MEQADELNLELNGEVEARAGVRLWRWVSLALGVLVLNVLGLWLLFLLWTAIYLEVWRHVGAALLVVLSGAHLFSVRFWLRLWRTPRRVLSLFWAGTVGLAIAVLLGGILASSLSGCRLLGAILMSGVAGGAAVWLLGQLWGRCRAWLLRTRPASPLPESGE